MLLVCGGYAYGALKYDVIQLLTANSRPPTLNGLIIEFLESIPSASVAFKINGYYVETLQTKDNIVKTARVCAPAAPTKDWH